jgi:hypothetical protein
MPSVLKRAAIAAFCAELYSSTRSGRLASTASTLGAMPSPRFGTAAAAGG